MKNNDLFGTLEESRELILLTEIIGWLHDIDKLDELHYKPGSRGHRIRGAVEFGLGLPFSPSTEEFGIIDMVRFKKFREFFQKDPRLIFPEYEGIFNSENAVAVGSPILYHHSSEDYPPRSMWEWMICGSDSRDSKEDRGNAGSNPTSGMASSPFGDMEEVPIKDLRNKRERLYTSIDDFLNEQEEISYSQLRQFMIKAIWDVFDISVADTHYPVNDVRLLDHGYMTGAIAKAALSAYVLNEKTKSEMQGANDIGEYIRNTLGFQALSITFDSYSYLSDAVKLADLIGRVHLYDEIRKGIKKLLEVDIPIGSSIYEDVDCIIVTV